MCQRKVSASFVRSLVRSFVCLFVCLFVLYQYILHGLILIAGRSFSILLFPSANPFSKFYQKGDRYMKNVYLSSKQILACEMKWHV